MAFRIQTMGGIRPRVPAHLLPEGYASQAVNCDFGYGELRSMRGGLAVGVMSNNPGSMFTDDGVKFFTWPGDVDAVPSPMVADQWDRIYFTGDDGFRFTQRSEMNATGGPPATSYKVGVPRPAAGPVLSGPAPAAASTAESRAYVIVLVNVYDEAGPPSDPVKITTDVTASVNVTVTKEAYGDFAPIKEAWVYRTPSGSTSANYYYAGKIPLLGVATGTQVVLADESGTAKLNESLSSTNYYAPDQALRGLMVLPGGILCAWKDKEIHFSDAYRPHAWNPANVKKLKDKIVGGIVHGSGAVITTTKAPYLLSGITPESMTPSRINVDQAGVSKWSIAVTDGKVAYASNDGIVTIVGAQASTMASETLFTRDVWRQRYAAGLATMRFSVWDGRLIVFSSANAFTPFMIRLDEAEGQMTDLSGMVAKCAIVSELSDQCYFANGNTLYQFAGGAQLPATWTSRERVEVRPKNYAIAQCMVEGAWQFELLADDQVVHTETLATGKTTFRLPSGYKAERFKIRMTGTGVVKWIKGASSAKDLGAA